MLGREREPFDRGPVHSFLRPWNIGLDTGLHLWWMKWMSSLLLWVGKLIGSLKMHFPMEVLLLCAAWLIGKWLYDWWKHWQLAEKIAEWHRADLKAARKRLGIKFRRTPHPPKLVALPCKLMVLSAVMLSQAAVSLAGHVSLPPPGPGLKHLGEQEACWMVPCPCWTLPSLERRSLLIPQLLEREGAETSNK